MSTHHEELQEIENAKYFWNNGGKWVVVVLVAAALGYLGNVVYQNYLNSKREEAAALAAKIKDGSSPELQQLKQNFADTSATAAAVLQTGAQYFNTGKLDEAVAAFQWVLAHSKEPLLQASAAQNLASAYIQQKKYDDALNALSLNVEEVFQPILEETKGDVYAAQGKGAEAKIAYQAALVKLPPQAPNRETLELKLGQL